MTIRIEPYTTEEQAAGTRDFNRRMRDRGQTEYLLAEQPPVAEPAGAPIRNRFYLASEDGAVRGGLLLAHFPAAFGTGGECDAINCREPLSEGIIDPRYSLWGVRMIKFMRQQGPYLFALGMGGEDRPFPRLLRSAGWTVAPVPFLYHVVRARRFLRELRVLQATPARRMLARFAAASGLSSVAIPALQFRAVNAAIAARGLSAEPVTEWDSWVDELWEQCRSEFSFAVRRDLHTVRALYPLEGRLRGYLFRQGGRPVGWAVALNTAMRGDRYFGDLRVATLLDCLALPGARLGAIALASRALERDGADLLVTNQSHTGWVRAFHAAGYLSASSNYTLALSSQLAAHIAAQPAGFERMHFTRGDGDGRIHL